MNRVLHWTASFRRLILGFLVLVITTSSHAAQPAENNDWEFNALIYLWAADIAGESSSGGDVDIDFDTLWDNLDMAFMGGFEARKGRWSLLLDPVYLKESGGKGWTVNLPAGQFKIPTNFDGSVKLESWITNFGVAYNIIDTDRGTLDILAGARYTWMDVDVELEVSNVITAASRRVTASEHNWDGVIGVKGDVRLYDKWTVPYRFDVGTGDSDFTLNAVAALAYQFKWGRVMAGYRYLHYDFDKDNLGVLLHDVDLKGPLLGAQFSF
ncbi:MAG: hypothetical protein JRI67_12960 [Deltaproteobacteria bacterium]|nr:hypothetical protein [Deltaproteobacteria bacterium]